MLGGSRKAGLRSMSRGITSLLSVRLLRADTEYLGLLAVACSHVS